MSTAPIFQAIDQSIARDDLSGAAQLLAEVTRAGTGPSYLPLFYAGLLAHKQGDCAKAVTSLEEAARQAPTDLRVLHQLGAALTDGHRFSDAMGVFQRVLAIQQDHIPTLIQVSFIFQVTGNPIACERTCKMILNLSPDNLAAYNNLGNAYKNSGRPHDALAAYQRALSIRGDIDLLISNFLTTLNYAPMDRADQRQHHEEYSRRWVRPLPPIPPPRKDGKITVGYVSGDFCSHSVAFFLESILKHHDKERFRVIGYSNTMDFDATTERLEQFCDLFRDIRNKPDEALAAQIRDDQVDILVDLSGHTAGNRLSVFGLKPAPVQITYLGYPNTTGLSTMDYRITTQWAESEDAQRYCSEKLLLMPENFSCYMPPAALPEPDFSDFRCRDNIVFGSFNNIAKLSAETIQLWTSVLNEVPGSRMVIKYKYFNDPAVRALFLDRFAAAGIPEERLSFLGYSFDLRGHFASYNSVDIALDSHPFNGATTTLEAMVMGVPTITLTGLAHASRVGTAFNHFAGLDDFVADSSKRFVEIAKEQAADRDTLLVLKEGMRAKMLASPICDGPRFTRQFEEVLESTLLSL